MRVEVGRPVRGATNPRNVVEVAVPEQWQEGLKSG